MDGNSKYGPPKTIVANGYDKVAQQYKALEKNFKWPRMEWLKKLLGKLEPGATILDLGCGSGDPADIEIAKLHHVTGVDISRRQIELARNNVPGGTFINEDASQADFPQGSFDAVVSFYTIEHIPRDEHKTILRRIHGWLKKGGHLLLSHEAAEFEDGFGEWLGVPMFFSCFDPETVKEIVVDAGFQLIEAAVETQLENDVEIPFQWIFARKK